MLQVSSLKMVIYAILTLLKIVMMENIILMVMKLFIMSRQDGVIPIKKLRMRFQMIVEHYTLIYYMV
jgi:hypothetical protein